MSSSDIKDTAQQVIEGPKQFFKDGFQFINRCKKPDQQGKDLDAQPAWPCLRC